MFRVRFRNASGQSVISERFSSEGGRAVVMAIDIVLGALEDNIFDVSTSKVFSLLRLNQICIVCFHIEPKGEHNCLISQSNNL